MTARDRTILLVVIAIAAIVAPWMLVISPKREEASKLGKQLSQVQSQLASAQAEVAAGEAARAQFPKSYAMLARLGEAVPADDNVASMIFQLQAAANATDVDFHNLTLTPGAATATSPTVAPTTAGSSAASSGSSSAGGAAASTASAAQSATAALPPGAAVGSAAFPTEPFTFTFQGNFFHLSNFLNRVQRFVVAKNKTLVVRGRLMMLNGISLGAGPKGFPQITATISATTFIVPATQGLLNGASVSGPAGSTTTTEPASTSSSPSPSTPAPAAVATAQ